MEVYAQKLRGQQYALLVPASSHSLRKARLRAHVRTHARTRTRAHARTHARTHAHTRARTHASTHARKQAQTHGRVRARARTKVRGRAATGHACRKGRIAMLTKSSLLTSWARSAASLNRLMKPAAGSARKWMRRRGTHTPWSLSAISISEFGCVSRRTSLGLSPLDCCCDEADLAVGEGGILVLPNSSKLSRSSSSICCLAHSSSTSRSASRSRLTR
eukprot:4222214-Pleurochrysis_carterae.AAC.3